MPLTNAVGPAHNENMKRIMRQTLVYSALSIALPIGWCCWLPTFAYASGEGSKKPTCCCCKEESTTKPAKPSPPVPIACCCEPMPATMPKVFDEYPDLDLLVTDLSLAHDDFIAEFKPRHSAINLFGPSPPLNLLHCVWLC